MKKIVFLVSLPRSGNTLLGSILNQNKEIACTANSIIFEVLHRIYSIKKGSSFLNFPDHTSFNNMTKKIITNYYIDWKQKIIIDRSPATTVENLTYFNYENHKFIFLKRDLTEVVKSFVYLYRKNQYKKTIDEVFNEITNPNHIFLKNILAISNGKKTINKENFITLDYNELIRNPKKQINKIYRFLNIPYFNHKFTNLDQFSVNNVRYNDDSLPDHFQDLHKIRTNKILKKEHLFDLPENIINFCRNFENEI